MKIKNFTKHLIILLMTVFCLFLGGCTSESVAASDNSDKFRILASREFQTLNLEEDLEKAEIRYMNDIDLIGEVNKNPKNYDAILVANSMWSYQLTGASVSESKSLAISPVVFGISDKSILDDIVKANGLEDVRQISDLVTTQGIFNLIQNNDKVKFVMPSPMRTNSGATAYFSFLNVLAGNPEVLSLRAIENMDASVLQNLFGNVEQVVGSEDFQFGLLEENKTNMLIATEASIIRWNLNHDNKLFTLYPVDGVAMADMTFSFIGSVDKKVQFDEYVATLTSPKVQTKLENNGYRIWYGGTKKSEDADFLAKFNPDWGIDTTRILKISSFPSKEVMSNALNLYVNDLKKDTNITFVIDLSGSMQYNGGEKELKNALDFLMNYDASDISDISQLSVRFGESDMLNLIYFVQGKVYRAIDISGTDVSIIYDEITSISASGTTPLYEAITHAFNIYKDMELEDETSYSIVVMTDGQPTEQKFSRFKENYQSWCRENPQLENIRVYTIAFGEADEKELQELAKLTNGAFFDGKADMLQAFKEIRGFN